MNTNTTNFSIHQIWIDRWIRGETLHWKHACIFKFCPLVGATCFEAENGYGSEHMHAFSSLAALRPRGLNQKMHLHCTHACIFKFWRTGNVWQSTRRLMRMHSRLFSCGTPPSSNLWARVKSCTVHLYNLWSSSGATRPPHADPGTVICFPRWSSGFLRWG